MDDIPLDFIFPGQGFQPPLPDKDKPEHLLIPKIDNGYYRRNQDNGYHYNSSVGCQFAAVGHIVRFLSSRRTFLKKADIFLISIPLLLGFPVHRMLPAETAVFFNSNRSGVFSCFS